VVNIAAVVAADDDDDDTDDDVSEMENIDVVQNCIQIDRTVADRSSIPDWAREAVLQVEGEAAGEVAAWAVKTVLAVPVPAVAAAVAVQVCAEPVLTQFAVESTVVAAPWVVLFVSIVMTSPTGAC